MVVVDERVHGLSIIDGLACFAIDIVGIAFRLFLYWTSVRMRVKP